MGQKVFYSCLVSGIGVLYWLVSCATTEETSRRQFNFIPDGQMHQLGLDAYKELLSKASLSKDETLNAKIKEIGQRIAKASGKDYQWEFSVIEDDDMVNAFCLPGGKIAVYTGILPVAENTAALAAVMGHEVAHATLRHGAERMSQTLVMQLGLKISDIAYSDSKHKNVIAAALGIGAMFGVMMPFSRFQESEADKVGLKYMAMAGYDPQEAKAFWERMAEKEGSTRLELLSTHPDPKRRAEDISKALPELNAIYDASDKLPSISLL